MNEHRLTSAARVDLLPWQAALMVVCVTAAGMLHEHPGAMRPLVTSLQTAQLRSGMAQGSQPADGRQVALWLSR